jgi:DNA-binding Lrp family transcriptional regulator
MPKNNYDTLDYQIIQELSNNSRKSAAQISKATNINERTIRRRIDRLIKDGAIRFSTIIDPSKFGYHSISDINLKVAPEHLEDFIEHAKSSPNICYIATGWGESNLSIETRFLDNTEMYDYINTVLPNIPGVEVLNFFIIPKIIYNIDEWIPNEKDFKIK